MANELAALSNELAAVVEQGGRAVVAVHARPRFSSSGVFWRPGVVVTAEHTIRREEDITVTLPDGKNAAATLAGSDPGTDLAVLKVDGQGGTASARNFGAESRADRPYDRAFRRFRGERHHGGYQRRERSLAHLARRRLDNYIRLDLTLYPGSSGGVVVNTVGEAIGIATSVLSRIAGLAIPTTTIDRVVNDILARGHVSRGYLGVGLQPVELPDSQKGLIVLSLEQGGPAAKAGLLVGDIVVSLDGAAVSDTDGIQAVLEGHAAGQSVDAGLLRGGAPRNIAITVGERPRRS